MTPCYLKQYYSNQNRDPITGFQGIRTENRDKDQEFPNVCRNDEIPRASCVVYRAWQPVGL